jgi:hypothetical protein
VPGTSRGVGPALLDRMAAKAGGGAMASGSIHEGSLFAGNGDVRGGVLRAGSTLRVAGGRFRDAGGCLAGRHQATPFG